jgi:hypothetical protein
MLSRQGTLPRGGRIQNGKFLLFQIKDEDDTVMPSQSFGVPNTPNTDLEHGYDLFRLAPKAHGNTAGSPIPRQAILPDNGRKNKPETVLRKPLHRLCNRKDVS